MWVSAWCFSVVPDIQLRILFLPSSAFEQIMFPFQCLLSLEMPKWEIRHFAGCACWALGKLTRPRNAHRGSLWTFLIQTLWGSFMAHWLVHNPILRDWGKKSDRHFSTRVGVCLNYLLVCLSLCSLAHPQTLYAGK
jgi:hypothetical protein